MIEPKEVQRYQRELRAMLRRIADEDPEGMAVIDQLLQQAAASVPLAVAIGKARQGWAYSELGRGFGTSKQGAQQRFSPFSGAALMDADAQLELLASKVQAS